ncbi:potassium channel family protein [Enterococcus nangangensis]
MEKNQTFAIIGLGRFGGSICRTLISSGCEVLAIDASENRVNEYMNIATHAVVADAQDEMVLKSLGLRNFDTAIVAIGEDIQASILVTLMLKEMGVPRVVAKAQNEYHARVLEKIGADRVVHPERDMGVRLAHNLISKNIMDYLELSQEYSIAEIQVSNAKFVNHTLNELNFRQRFNLNVIGIRRRGKLIIAPGAEELVENNDALLVIGEINDIDALDQQISL